MSRADPAPKEARSATGLLGGRGRSSFRVMWHTSGIVGLRSSDQNSVYLMTLHPISVFLYLALGFIFA